jgi:carboxymethylenebutenolidase
MSRETVEIRMPDGLCSATLHMEDAGSPGVLMYPDAGGPREVMREMADRVASFGYVVLLPDIYYRSAPYEPFDVRTIFSNPDERARMGSVAGLLTNSRLAEDAAAYADFLLSRAGGTSIGTVGYCLGGRMSLLAACSLGSRVAAAASFHGGRLAVADDPSSPHLAVSGISGVVYVAGAAEDPSFTPDQAELLEAELSSAGVAHTIETYPAGHGFAVTDNPTFDPAASSRHFDALRDLYGSALSGA